MGWVPPSPPSALPVYVNVRQPPEAFMSWVSLQLPPAWTSVPPTPLLRSGVLGPWPVSCNRVPVRLL